VKRIANSTDHMSTTDELSSPSRPFLFFAREGHPAEAETNPLEGLRIESSIWFSNWPAFCTLTTLVVSHKTLEGETKMRVFHVVVAGALVLFIGTAAFGISVKSDYEKT
jgi:hypothetical protein